MSQNRRPPAYQEYPAEILARIEFRAMTLTERGLLYTLRLECWVNHALPADPVTLAKILGLDRAEVEGALPAIMEFFAIENGKIVCPELENYREHIKEIRERQSAGGKKGAATAHSKLPIPSTPPLGNPVGKPRVEPRVPSKVKPSHVGEGYLTTSTIRSVEERGNPSSWTDDEAGHAVF